MKPCLLAVPVLLAATACTAPDLSVELQTFSSAVDDVTTQYSAALGVSPARIRADQIDAMVRNRKNILDLTTGCDAFGSSDARAVITDCRINDKGLDLPEKSLARAAGQMALIRDYVAALSLLAEATTPTDIENAAGAAIDAVEEFGSALPGEGLARYAATLQARRSGLTQAAGFLAEQYKFRKLRGVVAMADPAIQRLLLNLAEIAEDAGLPTTRAAYDALDQAQIAMDEAWASNATDAVYQQTIADFFAAHDAFVAQGKTGLIQRLVLVKATHGALRNRLKRRASPKDIIAFIDKLKAIDSGF